MNTAQLKCEYCMKDFRISESVYKKSISKGKPRKFCTMRCVAYGRKVHRAKNRTKEKQSMAQRMISDDSRAFYERLQSMVLVARPVLCFKDMSPEKQMEMRRLYEKPASDEREQSKAA